MSVSIFQWWRLRPSKHALAALNLRLWTNTRYSAGLHLLSDPVFAPNDPTSPCDLSTNTQETIQIATCCRGWPVCHAGHTILYYHYCFYLSGVICFMHIFHIGRRRVFGTESVLLTHWGRDKMAAISQTTFSSVFSWMKMFYFWIKFHWTLFLKV